MEQLRGMSAGFYFTTESMSERETRLAGARGLLTKKVGEYIETRLTTEEGIKVEFFFIATLSTALEHHSFESIFIADYPRGLGAGWVTFLFD